jgi:hypothetical protein
MCRYVIANLYVDMYSQRKMKEGNDLETCRLVLLL